jgi:hypothetical protein
VLSFERESGAQEPVRVWREDCNIVVRAEEAKSNEGAHQTMATSAKPVKKGKKLSGAKKLEKKTTLTKLTSLTNRFSPIVK